MIDLPSTNGSPRPGYRLKRLEVFNWGTFDSSRGNVHILPINGDTALLVGQNGSGKSTLVDALLTLLVRPVVRNYNVAAGAHKQERDERTYIKGAFGRFSRDEDNRADVQFLRSKVTHPSVLLAYFSNDQTGKSFTLAQLLYLDSDGGVEKIYCFATNERSITKDFANLTGTERIRDKLKRRGLRVTTSYTEYHSWFAKETGVQPKAMDMFNQTVAVKDIQKLNVFIREHMLEAKPWGKRIEGLLNHFMQLSEAHKSLVEARNQRALLDPVAEAGAVYREHERQLKNEQKVNDALDSFFRHKTITLFVPECESRRKELVEVQQRIKQGDRDLALVQEECRRLTNEIEEAGGDRLRQIPLLIENHETHVNTKRLASQLFHTALREVGIGETITDADSLVSARTKLAGLVTKSGKRITEVETSKNDAVVARAGSIRQLHDDEQELDALSQRRENLPEAFVTLRRRMCEDLRLPETDVPYVSELVAVKPEERAWESSIEMVLRSFALSLLVPERHYQLVSRYVDATKMMDSSGRGQRIVYLRVGQRQPHPTGQSPHNQSLLRKLSFREGHALLPWIKAELADRFDYRCCDTLAEFQAAEGRALTTQRHMKVGGVRHEKDDRDRSSDPRYFVLGWDNREKRKILAASIERLRTSVADMDRTVNELDDELSALRDQQTAANRALEVTDFDTIDTARHERAIKALQKERKVIEEGSDTIRLLKRRLAEEKSQHGTLTRKRDDAVGRERELTKEIATGDQAVTNARAVLRQRSSQGILASHKESFQTVESEFADDPLTAANLFERERMFVEQRRKLLDRLRDDIAPLIATLHKLMSRFLVDFPSEKADLQSDTSYLDSFLDLRAHLVREDLPRHEQRFKERLNEKVTHDIGLFNGSLQSECVEIKKKIEILNSSLCQLEYRTGTYMRLEPRPVRDREINEFQEALKECLAGTFEGTMEADEARYLRIEKLIVRLREESRWREKVADVRRWFDFAAREIDAATGQERAYYEDSTGQSGGEKAKLAFTILVAAIAYQYDLIQRHSPDRFHFVVVDEMFSKVDDQYAEFALDLFQKFGLQLLIVAPLDAKARVTEPYVGCYLHVVKDDKSNLSEILSMTACEFQNFVESTNADRNGSRISPSLSEAGR
ncbi:MAG: SbcC/MukB-like Walker B domain-containing protein [Pirellulales bacterium]